MGKTTLASGFSWMRGFLAHQQQRTPHSLAPINEEEKGPEEFEGPEAPLAQFSKQRKIATTTPTEPSATTNLALDRASPLVCRHEDSLLTTEACTNQANEAAISAPHTHKATTPHASREHDDGHIHRASPIRGLPPEPSFEPISLTETTRPVLLGTRHSQPKYPCQERNLTADNRDVISEFHPRPQQQATQTTSCNKTSPHSRKTSHHPSSCPSTHVERIILARKLCNTPAPSKPPYPREGLGDGMQEFDAQLEDQAHIANNDGEPPYPSITTPESRILNGGRSSARQPKGTKPTHGTHSTEKKEVPSTDEQATRSHLAWKKGFLANHNPPTRRPLPWSKPHNLSNSTNLTTNKNAIVSDDSGNKGQNVDAFRATQVPNTARPSVSNPTTPVLTERLHSTCLQRYDLRLCLYGQNGEVYSEWETLTNFFLRLQAIDDSIQLLPWQARPDSGNTPPIAISQCSQSFFDLHTYVPRLASTKASLRSRFELGNTRHPYLFLRSSVQPATLVDKMGPWLRATKQGMWPRQLPLVEQTKCIGWLLYSAPEYDLDELRRLLKHLTGVDVAL